MKCSGVVIESDLSGREEALDWTRMKGRKVFIECFEYFVQGALNGSLLLDQCATLTFGVNRSR